MAGCSDDDFVHISLTPELEQEYRLAFESNGGVFGAAQYLHEKSNEWKKIPIDIAITGCSGSGKSSFINAILGVFADDPGAAPIGVVETTRKAVAYSHPRNAAFRLWDLPGVGTPDFPKDTYLQKIELQRKDFFIILSSERFKENDAWLGAEILKAGKKFYFVRTKVDQDIANEMRSKRVKPTEESVLLTIRHDLVANLAGQCHDAPIFLIDNYDKSRFDFAKLESSLIGDFPNVKKEALLFSLGNMSRSVLEAKIAALRSRAHKAAILSGVVAIIPIPGVSLVTDVGILTEEIMTAFEQLGLDDESLRSLAALTNSDYEQLRKVVAESAVGAMAGQLSRQAVEALLKQAAKSIPAAVAAAATEEIVRFVPFAGQALASALSYGTNYLLLSKFLNEMHRVATKIMQIALEKTAGDISKSFPSSSG